MSSPWHTGWVCKGCLKILKIWGSGYQPEISMQREKETYIWKVPALQTMAKYLQHGVSHA